MAGMRVSTAKAFQLSCMFEIVQNTTWGGHSPLFPSCVHRRGSAYTIALYLRRTISWYFFKKKKKFKLREKISFITKQVSWFSRPH